jgi:probable HAF family extracellular repeat protein
MKVFFPSLALTLLAAMSCTPFASAQNQPGRSASNYNFSKPINFTGASDTFAYAVNNGGEIVGYYTGGGCSQNSCGFADVKNKFTTIECATENATDAFDISNKAEVVGAYAYVNGVNGFIWEGNGSCFSLNPDGSSLAEAWGVNDSGDVVGFSVDSASNFQGFLYKNSTYTNVSCSGWSSTRAYGINDAGVIVGDVSNSTSGPFSAMVYKSGKCTVFNFSGASSTSAKGINKKNQISGYETSAAGVTSGFVKTGKKFVTLSYPSSLGTLAYHLNDKGQVAGWYEDSAGAYHGFVATPKKQ